jgi:hypothetical protein
MAKYKIINEAGASLGLPFRPNEETVMGMKGGYPTQVLIRKKGNTQVLSGVVRYDDKSMDKVLKDSLAGMPELARAGIKTKALEVSDGMLILNVAMGITGFPKMGEFAKKMELLVQTLKNIVSCPGLKCRICGKTAVDQPVLINGLVDRACPGCIEKLDAEARELQATYEMLPMNISFAILAAAVLSIVGAAVYGAVIIATNKMFRLIAIGIGILIGKGSGKAAGRLGWEIQVLSGLFTIVSVLLGLVFCAGYGLHAHALKQGLTVNWAVFLENIPGILVSIKSDVLFSLGGGLIGAYYATRYTRKPKIAMKVEK